MQKMRELDFLKRSLSYNVMLKLYSQMGMYEKVDILRKEMEEKGIQSDRYTYSIQLDAYATTSNIEGMEKLLMKMEGDPLVDMNWNAYVVAANGYLKAGFREKCLPLLKRSEDLITGESRRFAYQILLTLYASMGIKDEVYRIWNLYKNIGRFYNEGYLCMMSSLLKLDDIEGAEKILLEWESRTTRFDIRLPNLLLTAYCKKGLMEKAEAFINKLIESGTEPNASTWDRLASGYRKNDQMEKAVEMMNKTFVASQVGWKPDRRTLIACFEFLKGQGGVEVAEEFIRLLKEQGHFSADTCSRFASYIKDANPESICS